MAHTEKSLVESRKVWLPYVVVAAVGGDPIAQGLVEAIWEGFPQFREVLNRLGYEPECGRPLMPVNRFRGQN